MSVRYFLAIANIVDVCLWVWAKPGLELGCTAKWAKPQYCNLQFHHIMPTVPKDPLTEKQTPVKW